MLDRHERRRLERRLQKAAEGKLQLTPEDLAAIDEMTAENLDALPDEVREQYSTTLTDVQRNFYNVPADVETMLQPDTVGHRFLARHSRRYALARSEGPLLGCPHLAASRLQPGNMWAHEDPIAVRCEQCHRASRADLRRDHDAARACAVCERQRDDVGLAVVPMVDTMLWYVLCPSCREQQHFPVAS